MTQYLKLTNFGFAISGGIAGTVSIAGIQVSLGTSVTVGGGTFGAKDNSVKLLMGGVLAGNDHSTGLAWNQINTYGNLTSDAWGLAAQQASNFNSVNFGCALQGIGTGTGGGSAQLTSATITIAYAQLFDLWPIGDAGMGISNDLVIAERQRAAHPAPVPYRCAAMHWPILRQTRTLQFAKPLPLFRAAA